MSLTSSLKCRTSPVALWFNEHFPDTRRLIAEKNRDLKTLAATERVPRVPDSDRGMVGMAVDYLVRATLSSDGLDTKQAHRGAVKVDRVAGEDFGTRLETEAARRVQELDPSRRVLDETDWQRLCRNCIVLARLEQVFRSGAHSLPGAQAIDEARRSAGSLDRFCALAASDATREDLSCLGRAAVEDHEDLRTATPLVLNPEFAQTGALDGADASS